MSYDTYRIYGGLSRLGIKSKNKPFKGRKKKVRRCIKAYSSDGFERKKSNGLSPQFKTSKKLLQAELNLEGVG